MANAAVSFLASPLASLPALSSQPHKIVHLIRHAQVRRARQGQRPVHPPALPRRGAAALGFLTIFTFSPCPSLHLPSPNLPSPPRRRQGTHNLAVAAAGGQDGGSGSAEEEYKNWKWHDARLTPAGEAQARALRPKFADVPIDVVLTSPLSRTVQTALLAVPPGPPLVCEDGCRERNGQHPCDKRRPKAELAADFPSLSLDHLQSEEDDKWTVAREPMEALVARASQFLHTLRARPETNIAVVTHNDFLTALLYESELRLADPKLRRKFGNCDHMAIVLTWSGPAGADGAEEGKTAAAGAAATASVAGAPVSTASSEAVAGE